MAQQARERRITGSRIGALAVLITAGLLAGCSGSHPGAAHPAAGPGHQMRFRLADAATGPVTTRVPSQPIGSTPTSVAGLTLNLYVVQRSGPQAVLLVFGLVSSRPVGDEASQTDNDIWEGLSANYYNGVGNSESPSVSGVSLLDSANLKQYLTYNAHPDVDADCLCSALSRNISFRPGAVEYFAALVAAPPAGASSLSFVSGLGSIGDVQLSG